MIICCLTITVNGKISMDFKALVESLSDPDISKRNYDSAIEMINRRVDDIWRYICQKSDRHLAWWMFQNGDYEAEDAGGDFDPVADKNFITIEGEFSGFYADDDDRGQDHNYKYHDGFPTELLWADYQVVVEQHIAEVRAAVVKDREQRKQKKKDKAQRRVERMQGLKDKTKTVLSEEEYSFLLGKLEHRGVKNPFIQGIIEKAKPILTHEEFQLMSSNLLN